MAAMRPVLMATRLIRPRKEEGGFTTMKGASFSGVAVSPRKMGGIIRARDLKNLFRFSAASYIELMAPND